MNIQTLSCDICGYRDRYSINPIHEHPELDLGGVPLNIWTPEYFLETVQELKADNTKRGIQRYHAQIPIKLCDNIVSSEGNTPLFNLGGFYLKDESTNPTGSFKDRGMAALMSEAADKGIKKIAIPSTGNAAISLGYYGNRAGIETLVFIPANTPDEKVKKIREYSEMITDSDLIESYEHFFRFCKENKETYNGFPANNIAYLQGLKTTAYELFIQLGDSIPDYVIVPVGSGGNLVGLYYGFKDLMVMGLSDKMPRLVSVQLSGADPITQGVRKNQTEELLVLNCLPQTRAEAISSDTCFNYFKIMEILAETNGRALSVTEDDINRSPEYNLEYSSRCVFPALEILRLQIADNNGDKMNFDKIVLIGTAIKKGD